MSWIGLRHKGVEILFPEEWNAVVDALDILKYYTDQSLKLSDLPKLPSDVAPDVDNLRDLGAPDRRWQDVYAYYGYFYGYIFTDAVSTRNLSISGQISADTVKANYGYFTYDVRAGRLYGDALSVTGDVSANAVRALYGYFSLADIAQFVRDVIAPAVRATYGYFSELVDTKTARATRASVADRLDVFTLYATYGYISQLLQTDTLSARSATVAETLGAGRVDAYYGYFPNYLETGRLRATNASTDILDAQQINAVYGLISNELDTEVLTASYGYFNVNAYVAGRAVLKEGDAVITAKFIEDAFYAIQDIYSILLDAYGKILEVDGELDLLTWYIQQIYFNTLRPTALETLTLAVGLTPVPLSQVSRFVRRIHVKVPTNALPLYVGDANQQNYVLEPGDIDVFEISDPSKVYVKSIGNVTIYIAFEV